jgi:cellulose synthase/poly-beta-1,6-N-acetylglucosamine synthase-like glycosyltransferase
MDALLAICLALCLAGLLQSALMLLHAWEHRRYHRSRLAAELDVGNLPRVTLFVPCKGQDAGMEANLRALFTQRYEPLELCFLVESDRDESVAAIRRLQGEYPAVDSRLVFTGIAADCGQKVHNLIRGTQSLPPGSGILAFVDSDACPHPDWLARLVARLQSGKFAVATGYRWYVPVRPTLANRVLSAINNTVVSVMGPHGFNLVWGGAWAIRTDDFAKIGLPDAWRGSLSDDLVVSRLVHESHLKVAYEPHGLVRSPADFSWRALAEFLRRQYLVARVYAPTWWRFAALSAGLTNAIFWSLAGLALWCARTDGPWPIALLGLACCYGGGALRNAISARAVRPFVDVTDGVYAQVATINIWGWPVVSLITGLGLLASAIGRTIVWRGIRYVLVSPRETTILGRTADGEALLSKPSSGNWTRAA